MTKKNILKPFAFITLICVMMPFVKTSAQFYYSEPGTKKTGLFKLNEVPGSEAVYTAALSSYPDPEGEGWIRLTEDAATKFGCIVLDKTFTSDMGATIEFDFKIWGARSQGDGFCVFLIDASPGAAAFTQGGARGGGLGFAQNGISPGAKPTYIGVGLDEFGNFSADEGVRSGGPGQRTNSVSIRAGSIISSTYHYLKGTNAGVTGFGGTGLNYNQSYTIRPGDNLYYRRAKIEFDPITGGGTQIKVYLKANKTDEFTKVLEYDFSRATSSLYKDPPTIMRLGFSATTGASYAVHEIRNVIARASGDFQVIKKISDALNPNCLSRDLTFQTVVNSELNDPQSIQLRDTMPDGYYVIDEPGIPSGATSSLSYSKETTNDGTNRTVYVYNMTINKHSTLEITYNGRFGNLPSNGDFYTAAGMTGYTSPTGSNRGMYARLNGSLSQFITRESSRVILYDKKNIPTTPLQARASTGASFQWKYLDASGNWTNVGSNSDTFQASSVSGIATMLNAGKSVFIRCFATWTGGCISSDNIDFVYTSYPDNVMDPDCYITAPTVNWSFRQAAVSTTEVHNYISPLVGNIDGDDIVEIIVSASDNTAGGPGEYQNKVLIFKGNNISQPAWSIPTQEFYTKAGVPYAIAKWNNTTYLILAARDRYLYAYDINANKNGSAPVQKWKSSAMYSSRANAFAAPGFADFNSDGKPEIYIGGSIYDIETGKLLVSSPNNTGYTFLDGESLLRTIAADVDNDGFLEYVAGNEVYSVNINGQTASMALKYKLTSPSQSPSINGANVSYGDGQTQVIDWDGDGLLDIVVSHTNNTGRIFVYIWNAITKNVMAYYASPDISALRAYSSMSIPMFGSVDGDDRPEMVFVTQKRLNILRHAPNAANRMSYDFITSTDASGFTGATLFDFNQDGTSELVYRDETHLRIMNLSSGHINDLVKLSSYSQTWGEYPVVVDIDNDGSAEIISIGGSPGASYKGMLRIYKSGDPNSPWASARKVWNQYAYNPTFVNEDLTIPNIPINPALKMAGKPGSNGVQPFNNFLQQATIMDMNGVPFWLTPRAEHREDPVFDYFEDGDSLHIYLKVTNTGTTAFNSPFYISTFRKDGNVFTFIKDDSIMQKIEPNQVVEKRISLKNIKNYGASDSIVVRLNNKNGYAQLQCEYTKNSNGELVWKIKHLNPDYQSVQKYYSINVDVLGNDEIPTGFFPRDFSLKDSITVQPKAGTLYTSGTGSLSKLIYVSDGRSLTNSIDSFQYRLYFQNRSDLPARPYTAWAYIYTLEDVNGAVRCQGTQYVIRTIDKPTGVKFYWRMSIAGGGVMSGYASSVTVAAANVIDRCEVTIENVAGFGDIFPKVDYKLNTITPTQGSMIQMRWTGDFDTNWMNPANWALVTTEGGRQIERPAQSPPSTCMDAIIPSNVDNYPELTYDAQINNILMKDRSMIKNPHRLNYNQAAVELKFKPSEFDRFVMLSAPLQGMTSGDYSYTIKNQAGSKGDVFMSLFQQKSPDDPNTSITKNHFTATFGKTDLALEPGMGFNINVRSTTMNRDSLMRFPHGANTGAKFITHNLKTTQESNVYELPVIGDITGGDIVQVVNPYMAYLNLGDFLNSNSADLKSGYYIWNGELKNGFTTVMMNSDKRIVVAGNPDSWMDAQTNIMIAPLQSFFVAKKNSSAQLSKLKISPNWTSTKNGNTGKYTLRSENAANINGPGTLGIKLSQGGKSAFAALMYDRSASPFVESNDMPVIIYDELPLSVYTLAVTREPLYINTNGMFSMFNLPLGLRAKDAEETKLEFTGLETFGHDVTLIDKQLNRSIDLQKTPEYTFALKKTGSSTLELNDRFELHFSYTGKGLGTGTEDRPEAQSVLKVSAANGHIDIVSNKGNISSLYIYDAGGKLVYGASEVDRNSFSMQAIKQRVYIIKALVDGELIVEKVIVK